uniref:Uncharacterized protein n=1 Tax=viral metagenome TaxID=1070528 RepID=A0A6C0CGQ1_9ZZZZ
MFSEISSQMRSLHEIALRQVTSEMSLRQTVSFVSNYSGYLDIEKVRELLATKLRVFDPHILVQRMDLTTTQQLLEHVRALLAGTSHKYGYTIGEDGRNTTLTPYYSLEVAQGTTPIKITIDGLLPASGMNCLMVTIDDHLPIERPFFFRPGDRPDIDVIRRYIASKTNDILIDSNERLKTPEWFEIRAGEDNVVVPRKVLKVEENWETEILDALSFFGSDFIENELDCRVKDIAFDTLSISFGGNDPNWNRHGFDHSIYIDFVGYVIETPSE